MRPPDSYSAFALVYDRGLGQLFFDGIRPVLDRLDREYPSVRRTHLDLACGTGLVVGHFVARGWDSIGLDASVDMLAHARRRGHAVLAADVRAFALRRTFARITCLYDSLNHVMDEDDLLHVLSSVRELMDRESLFWFDLNHPATYGTVWSIPEPYRSSGEGWSLSIDTRYDAGRNLAAARVTGNCVVEGEIVEIDEVHHQRAWEQGDVRRLLEAAGLRVVDTLRFNPFHPAGESGFPMKVMYVVGRKSKGVGR